MKQAREAAGMSQGKLAEAVGMRQPVVRPADGRPVRAYERAAGADIAATLQSLGSPSEIMMSSFALR